MAGPYNTVTLKVTFPLIEKVAGVSPRLGDRLKKSYAEASHAKVITADEACAMVEVNEYVHLDDLEQVIPYEKARDLIIEGSHDIAVINCGCREARENPCLPLDVCIIIGRPLVDYVLEYGASSRKITKDEALQIILAEKKRGHFQTAWFSTITENRFHSICNCCSCCCLGVEGMLRYGIPMLAPSGNIAEVDPGLCSCCGECVALCPFEAVSMDGSSDTDREACMGCGLCVDHCEAGARSLVLDEEKGVPLDLRRLAAH